MHPGEIGCILAAKQPGQTELWGIEYGFYNSLFDGKIL
jgi:hypothetical protein